MSFYWIKTKSFIKRLFSNYVWDLPNTQNKIYLTFDDGPTPEITEKVIEILEKCISTPIQLVVLKSKNTHNGMYKRWAN